MVTWFSEADDYDSYPGKPQEQSNGPDTPKSKVPVMALRPLADNPDLMDDIVVKDVTMFRAEAMDDGNWWICCYLSNDERVAFSMTAHCRPRRLECVVTEKPSEWVDLDTIVS